MPSADLSVLLADFFASQPRVLEWGTVRLGDPLPNSEKLKTWVAEGLHAGLRYMEERQEERRDPIAFVPWARTVVLFSLRQPVPFGADTGDFRVASYALGEDYHRFTHRILDGLEESLQAAFPDLKFLRFCDTGPVFERDLAAEAGLGWRGKNACLIHKTHGSGFLLAGFFLDVDLESVRAPSPDFCGGCTACLDACPTEALIAPGRLDANKCVSYWTVESKAEIPAELGAKFGNLIFGCDICQDVCPWNRKPKQRAETPVLEEWPRAAEEWLALLRKGGGFRSRFRRTPLLRAGRRSLLRNALNALRNTDPAKAAEWTEILKADEASEGTVGAIHVSP